MLGSEKSGPARGRFRFRGRRRPADRRRRRGGARGARRSPTRARARSGCRSATARRWRRATIEDIERLRGAAAVDDRARRAAPTPALPTRLGRCVRATGKPSDGLVSRWLNRPISQRITWLVLAIPGVRPVHVTIFNALLAIVMFAVLLARRPCRADRRRHPVSGRLDHRRGRRRDGARDLPRLARPARPWTVVDIATNLLFVLALTVNLALRDHDAIGWIGGWAVTLSILGGNADRLAHARRRRRRSASICSSAPAPASAAPSTSSTGPCRRSPAATASPSCSWC